MYFTMYNALCPKFSTLMSRRIIIGVKSWYFCLCTIPICCGNLLLCSQGWTCIPSGPILIAKPFRSSDCVRHEQVTQEWPIKCWIIECFPPPTVTFPPPSVLAKLEVILGQVEVVFPTKWRRIGLHKEVSIWEGKLGGMGKGTYGILDGTVLIPELSEWEVPELVLGAILNWVWKLVELQIKKS